MRRRVAAWLHRWLTLGDLYCPWCEHQLRAGDHVGCAYLELALRGNVDRLTAEANAEKTR